MAEPTLEIRAFREADEADVTALWSSIFPDARVWNQPRAYIERKLGVQRELFLVGEREDASSPRCWPATTACAVGSIISPWCRSCAGTVSAVP
jgi:hypothetical protein